LKITPQRTQYPWSSNAKYDTMVAFEQDSENLGVFDVYSYSYNESEWTHHNTIVQYTQKDNILVHIGVRLDRGWHFILVTNGNPEYDLTAYTLVK